MNQMDIPNYNIFNTVCMDIGYSDLEVVESLGYSTHNHQPVGGMPDHQPAGATPDPGKNSLKLNTDIFETVVKPSIKNFLRIYSLVRLAGSL